MIRTWEWPPLCRISNQAYNLQEKRIQNHRLQIKKHKIQSVCSKKGYRNATGRALGFDERGDSAIGMLVSDVEMGESEGGEIGSDGRRSEERKMWKRRMEMKKRSGVRYCCRCRHGCGIRESELIGILVVDDGGISCLKKRLKKRNEFCLFVYFLKSKSPFIWTLLGYQKPIRK